jgi:hypothetical protein
MIIPCNPVCAAATEESAIKQNKRRLFIVGCKPAKKSKPICVVLVMKIGRKICV